MSGELTCCSVSVVIFCLGFGAFLVGVASPFWYTVESEHSVTDLSYNFGIYWGCVIGDDDLGIETDCETYDMDALDAWHKGSQALVSVGIGLGVFALSVAMFPPVSSALQMAAGVFAVGGSAWFMTKWDEEYSNVVFDQDYVDEFWAWGFFLAVVGGAVMIFNGIGVAILACASGCNMRPLSCCCGDRRYKV